MKGVVSSCEGHGSGQMGKLDSLFCSHGFELDSLIRVLSTTCWASAIQVLLDVVPTETTNLQGIEILRVSKMTNERDASAGKLT